MHTHLADLIPQRHEVAEGLGLVLGLAPKGLLKENIRGVSSSMLMQQSSQA